MTAGTDAIVELQGLRKVYGSGTVAIANLDLSLGTPGTVHGFLGPNGSGKTTTIRCLLGLIKPSAGSARVFGVDATSDLHTVIHRIGAIVENPKLFPKFSGRKNLRLLAGIGGLDNERVEYVLHVVGLSDRGDDTFESYSLGMKQRLAIAAALLKDPDLLILDEPANGLDPAGIAEMRVLIRSIADQGKAVLVSSHQLSEIEQVCDAITIIDRGQLVQSGSLDEVRQSAGGTKVIVKIDDALSATAALRNAGIGAEQNGADMVVVEIDADDSPRVSRALAEAGLWLRELRVERATLESAFLELTTTSDPLGSLDASAPQAPPLTPPPSSGAPPPPPPTQPPSPPGGAQ